MTAAARWPARSPAARSAREEVTQAHLDRIEAVDGAVHAFLHVSTESALAAGRRGRRGQRRRRRTPASPLAGVPLALKDIVVQQGIPTTAGSKILAGLDPAVRRHRHHQAAGRRHRDPGQDQPGRVRDGLVHRELGLRTHPQPVGPDQDPRRLRRRLGGRAGRVRGAAGHRHRHRRLDPAARRRHRHRRHQAHLRRGVPVRGDRAGLLAGPGRALCAHRDRHRAAA